MSGGEGLKVIKNRQTNVTRARDAHGTKKKRKVKHSDASTWSDIDRATQKGRQAAAEERDR